MNHSVEKAALCSSGTRGGERKWYGNSKVLYKHSLSCSMSSIPGPQTMVASQRTTISSLPALSCIEHFNNVKLDNFKCPTLASCLNLSFFWLLLHGSSLIKIATILSSGWKFCDHSPSSRHRQPLQLWLISLASIKPFSLLSYPMYCIPIPPDLIESHN